MSVYSGFSTRKLENDYGNLTSALISLLHYKVINEIKGLIINQEQWTSKFVQIHSQMARLELNKHLPPKFSVLCNELAFMFGENINVINYKTPEVSRPVSLVPPPVRFPELTKIKEFNTDVKYKKEEIRYKRQRNSVDPSPKHLKSMYYEKALEKYFDVSQHYEKPDDTILQDLAKVTLHFQKSSKST